MSQEFARLVLLIHRVGNWQYVSLEVEVLQYIALYSWWQFDSNQINQIVRERKKIMEKRLAANDTVLSFPSQSQLITLFIFVCDAPSQSFKLGPLDNPDCSA